VRPKSLGPLLQRIFSLHHSRGVNIFLADSEFEINDIFGGVAIDSSDSRSSFVILTA
jgi:hypothetical protein